MLDADLRQRLRDRLDAARADLLASLEGVTDREFGADLGGESVVQLLARVAAEERAAVAEARGEHPAERVLERPMPPQAVHALAGARYRTVRYLESDEATEAAAVSLVESAERREAEAARRIRERPELPPLPVTPVIPVLQPGTPPHRPQDADSEAP